MTGLAGPDAQRKRKGTMSPEADLIKPSLAAARSVRLGRLVSSFAMGAHLPDDPMGGPGSRSCPMSKPGCEAQRRTIAVRVRRLSSMKKRGRTAALPRFPMKGWGPPSAGLSRYGASVAVLRRWARTDALRTGSLATSLAADMIAMTSTPE